MREEPVHVIQLITTNSDHHLDQLRLVHGFPVLRLVWPLLTSANPSRHLSTPVAQGMLTDPAG